MKLKVKPHQDQGVNNNYNYIFYLLTESNELQINPDFEFSNTVLYGVLLAL